MEVSTVSILIKGKARSYEDRYVTLLSLNIGKACRLQEHSLCCWVSEQQGLVENLCKNEKYMICEQFLFSENHSHA